MEGEFTLKFSILTFGDIQNQSTLRSPAQALPFQGADLDLSHVAGPPPATSPSTLLLPVPPRPAVLGQPMAPVPAASGRSAAFAGPTPPPLHAPLRSARAHAESPSLVHPSSTCWAPLSAGAAGQPGCRGKGTASCLGTPQGRCHDGRLACALAYSVSRHLCPPGHGCIVRPGPHLAHGRSRSISGEEGTSWVPGSGRGPVPEGEGRSPRRLLRGRLKVTLESTWMTDAHAGGSQAEKQHSEQVWVTRRCVSRVAGRRRAGRCRRSAGVRPGCGRGVLWAEQTGLCLQEDNA